MKFKEFKQKIISKYVYPILKFYWRTFKPKSRGVKCVITFGEEILLIRNTYGGRHWTFSGGGAKRVETPEEAVKREVMEEVGLAIEKPKPIGNLDWGYEGKKDVIYCFAAEVNSKNFKIDTTEILEAKWFKIAEVPALPPFAQKIFVLWQNKVF